MIVTLHEVRLRVEARAKAARAAELLRGSDLSYETLEAAYGELCGAYCTIHDLLTARLRGGEAGAIPRVKP